MINYQFTIVTVKPNIIFNDDRSFLKKKKKVGNQIADLKNWTEIVVLMQPFEVGIQNWFGSFWTAKCHHVEIVMNLTMSVATSFFYD